MVHGVAFREERGAIDHEVNFADEGINVGLRDVLGNGFHLDERIQLEAAFNGFTAGLAEVIVCHEKLTVQVGRFQVSSMGDVEGPDSGSGEFKGDSPPDAASTRDEDAGLFQFFLSGFSDTGRPHSPAPVAGSLKVAQHDGSGGEVDLTVGELQAAGREITGVGTGVSDVRRS